MSTTSDVIVYLLNAARYTSGSGTTKILMLSYFMSRYMLFFLNKYIP